MTLMSRNASSDENGRIDEFFSNMRFSCRLHRGLSGTEDFDKFQSNSSKHNLLGGNNDVDKFLSNYREQHFLAGNGVLDVDGFILANLTISTIFMQIRHECYARKTWDVISFVPQCILQKPQKVQKPVPCNKYMFSSLEKCGTGRKGIKFICKLHHKYQLCSKSIERNLLRSTMYTSFLVRKRVN